MPDKFSNANPQFRDSVFRDYFNDKVRLLSLCNALLQTDYNDPELLEINTLQGNFFSGQKNDISCRIDNKWLILVEHQSSINPNMAFRCLLYVSQLLNNLVTNKDSLYQGELLIFPEPQCFVLYDGDDSEPLTKEIRLSDSFHIGTGKMELVVTSYNINYGLNQPLLKSCSYLNNYSTLVGKVKQGLRAKLSRRDAIIQAINWCIANNIMAEYLIIKRDEVFSMLDLQWDFEEAKLAWFKQGAKKGEERGREEERFELIKNLFNVGTPIQYIVNATGWSEEKLLEFKKSHIDSQGN